MNSARTLHGGCHCGRNCYIIQFPTPMSTSQKAAQVVFNTPRSYRLSEESPLSAFLRVPLQWYHSTTIPYLPDETNSMIHRVYTSPREQHAMRHFCGFCGTPLSYWSEEPRSEADFIQLTLGSLSPEDLADLDDLGFLPSTEESSDAEEEQGKDDDVEEVLITTATKLAGAATGEKRSHRHISRDRETVGALPWLDTLTAGSRLGNIRSMKGRGASRDGTVRVEWEVVEWTEGDDDMNEVEDATAGSTKSNSNKRKLNERDNSAKGPGAMEGVQQH